MIKAILAVNNLGYIGKDNKLMWRSSEDFKHFKSMTTGNICIVGSKTYEGDLGGKPLPNRTFFVIGRNYITSPEEALKQAKELQETTKQEIFVIGGASIYESLKNEIDQWHVSVIDNNDIGDKKIDLSDINSNTLFGDSNNDKIKFYYFKTNEN